MKLLEVLGVVLLVGLLSLPFVSFVSAGEFDFQFSEGDENVIQYNEVIPTNWSHSQVFDSSEVSVGETYFVSPLGQLVSSLDAGVIYTAINDGNLLLVVDSINESACDVFAEIQGVTYPLSVAETKVLPVLVGERFGLKFTVTALNDLNCSLNFDLNTSYMG